MARIALLANRESGAGAAGEIERLLGAREPGLRRFDICDADIAAEWRPERVVVAGGDGSIGRGAELAAAAGAPLAVVPVGTANDFARALDLPLDARTAAELALTGDRFRKLDLGLFVPNGGPRPFVNVASAGLSPIAAREARGLKRLLGPLAYSVGALRAGLRAHPVPAHVRCDGADAFAGRAWQVTVAVTGAFGGGAQVEADPRDGILDVIVIEAGSRARLLVHAYRLRAGRLRERDDVHRASGREIEVEIDGGDGFNVDGELVDARRLRLSVRPRAFQVVVG